MESSKNLDTDNSVKNRLQILNDRLVRANFKQRIVLLERAYINAMRTSSEDADYLNGLIALLETWGKTTGQSFENHIAKLSLKLVGHIFGKISVKLNDLGDRINDLRQNMADFVVEIKSVPVEGTDENN